MLFLFACAPVDPLVEQRAAGLLAALDGSGWWGQWTACVQVYSGGGILDPDPPECAEGAEAEAAVIAELNAHNYPVVGADACATESTSYACTVDATTGEDAREYYVGCPEEQEDGTWKISVAWRHCDLAAEGYECTLVETADGWEAQTCFLAWIS